MAKFKKVLGGKEDLALGNAVVNQSRNGVNVPITSISADTLPYEAHNGRTIKQQIDLLLAGSDDIQELTHLYNNTLLEDAIGFAVLRARPAENGELGYRAAPLNGTLVYSNHNFTDDSGTTHQLDGVYLHNGNRLTIDFGTTAFTNYYMVIAGIVEGQNLIYTATVNGSSTLTNVALSAENNALLRRIIRNGATFIITLVPNKVHTLYDGTYQINAGFGARINSSSAIDRFSYILFDYIPQNYDGLNSYQQIFPILGIPQFLNTYVPNQLVAAHLMAYGIQYFSSKVSTGTVVSTRVYPALIKVGANQLMVQDVSTVARSNTLRPRVRVLGIL